MSAVTLFGKETQEWTLLGSYHDQVVGGHKRTGVRSEDAVGEHKRRKHSDVGIQP